MTDLSAPALAFSEIIIEVFRVNGLALAAGDRLARPAELSSARWQLLGVVDHGSATVASIARTMGLTRQSVQLTANALVEAGLVELAHNPEHRSARLIAITATGRRALRKVEARHAAWADRLGCELGLPDLRATLDGLRRVRATLEAQTEKP